MTDYKMVGNDLYDYRSVKIGTVKGADVFNERTQKVGTIRDYEVFDDRYTKLCLMRGDDIFDEHNVRMISVSEIKRMITNPPINMACVALWWFFIKK